MSFSDWDRSHEWVLLRVTTHWEDLAILFAKRPPSAEYLCRVRRAFPELRALPPKALCGRISADGRLHLGRRGRSEAEGLASSAAREGVTLERVAQSETGYLPMDRTENSILLIEHPVESARVVREMLAAGVPVEEMSPD